MKKLISYGYNGPYIIEREISGPQQRIDIIKARDFLLSILKDYIGMRSIAALTLKYAPLPEYILDTYNSQTIINILLVISIINNKHTINV